jgi:hypothetical protein
MQCWRPNADRSCDRAAIHAPSMAGRLRSGHKQTGQESDGPANGGADTENHKPDGDQFPGRSLVFPQSLSGRATHPPQPAKGRATHPPQPAKGRATHPPQPASGHATHPPQPASGPSTAVPYPREDSVIRPRTPASGHATRRSNSVLDRNRWDWREDDRSGPLGRLVRRSGPRAFRVGDDGGPVRLNEHRISEGSHPQRGSGRWPQRGRSPRQLYRGHADAPVASSRFVP